MTASINGPREVAGAITASTLTTVAVFLPLGFVGGLVSQFFLPFALTVTFALLASLVVRADRRAGARLLPHPRRQASSVDETGEPTRSIWVRAYTPAIRFVLRGRCDQARRRRRRGASCSSPRPRLAPLLPTQFINAGSEKTAGRDRLAAHRRELRGRPRAGDRGRDDPPRRRRGRARPDERPGRGRHELAGLPVGAPGPSRQQRDDDRPAEGRGSDVDAASARLAGRARTGRDRRLRRDRLGRRLQRSAVSTSS